MKENSYWGMILNNITRQIKYNNNKNEYNNIEDNNSNNILNQNYNRRTIIKYKKYWEYKCNSRNI